MSRTPLFHQFSRTIGIAWSAERNKSSTGEALAVDARMKSKTVNP